MCWYSAEAYERVVDAIFSMPSDTMSQDEVPGTPNTVQVSCVFASVCSILFYSMSNNFASHCLQCSQKKWLLWLACTYLWDVTSL